MKAATATSNDTAVSIRRSLPPYAVFVPPAEKCLQTEADPDPLD
jgi:hypothetical protein